MSITLDPVLKTAQDGQSHKPILEILSKSEVDEIPFDGQFLTDESTNEQRPNMVTHSSGRICGIYTYSTNELRYVYTDTDRTVWNSVNLTAATLGCSGKTIIEASVCELIDGKIGIIFSASLVNDFFLRYAILSVDGTVESTGLIATYDGASYSDLKSPFVLTLASGSYLLAYILDDDSDLSRIYKRTSNDFSSWSAEAEITFASLTTNTKENVSLAQIDTGNIFIGLDYYDDTNYSNIYYGISSDDGVTWTDATAITSYSDASASGLHPIIFQKITNQIYVVFHEKRGALHLGEGDPGWPPWIDGAGVSDLTIDTIQRRIWCTCCRTFTGTKSLVAVVEVDIDTFKVVRYWTTETIPAFSSHFAYPGDDIAIWYLRHQGAYPYIPIGDVTTACLKDLSGNDPQLYVDVLNVQTDMIRTYEFGSSNSSINYWAANAYLVHTHIDGNYLYALSQKIWSSYGTIDIFKVDLSNGSVEASFFYDGNSELAYGTMNGKLWVDSVGRIFISSSNTLSDWKGALLIIDPNHSKTTTRTVYAYDAEYHLVDGYPQIASGLQSLCLAFFSYDHTANFPYRGIKRFVVVGSKIYGTFEYDGTNDPDHRGIVEIDLAATGINPDIAGTPALPGPVASPGEITSATITYHRPTYATLDDYGFEDITATDDGKLIITGTYGVSIFDPLEESWRLINNSTLPGFTPDGEDVCWPVKYDSVLEMIHIGIPRHSESIFEGLVGLSINGYLLKSYYKIGTYAAGSWSFAAAAEWVRGILDYEAVVALDPVNSSIYTFWTNKTGSELSIKWDKEEASFNLLPYLLVDTELILKWTIENKPGELSFSISHGHLFDPSNLNSLLRQYLLKGRKITIRIGETVSGTDYWQDQGTFFVTEVKLSGFERGKYPTASVRCEDEMTFLDEIECITTADYSTTPKAIIEDVLTDITYGGLNIPTFDESVTIYRQWLNTNILQIISEVCDRFGYFLIVEMDGNLTCRKISDENSINHTYTDNNSLIRWSPQDDQADFVNQITIIGEEHDYIDVTYAEENITTKAGTTGWWSGGEEIKIYYSEDKIKKCIYPRLKWEAQMTGLGVWEDNINASIEEHDDQLGCDLIIDAPNYTKRLSVFLGLIILKWSIPEKVQTDPATGIGTTIPFAAIAEGALLASIFDILLAITNWQASIYAQPVGKVRRSIQAISNDTDHQLRIGKVISETIEEPMCYTIDQCQTVADIEIMLKKLQRNRMTISKITHLMDEVGDTIRMVHPYSERNVDIFITSLTRRYKKAYNSDGYVIDDIEGWKL